MTKCTNCKRKFPDHLVSNMFINGGYVLVCPICALEIREKVMGVPASMGFQGEMASEMLDEAIEFLEDQKGKHGQ